MNKEGGRSQLTVLWEKIKRTKKEADKKLVEGACGKNIYSELNWQDHSFKKKRIKTHHIIWKTKVISRRLGNTVPIDGTQKVDSLLSSPVAEV